MFEPATAPNACPRDPSAVADATAALADWIMIAHRRHGDMPLEARRLATLMLVGADSRPTAIELTRDVLRRLEGETEAQDN